MKKTLIVIAALFVGISAFCQSVNLDRFHVGYACRNLPLYSQPEDNRTFSVSASFTGASEFMTKTTSDFENGIEIEGLKHLDANGAIQFNFEFSGITIRERGVKEQLHEDKDKDGKVTKRWYTFYPFVDFSYLSKYSVVGPDGKELYSRVISSPNDVKSYTGKEYEKNKDAVDYLKLNGDIIVGNLENKAITDAIVSVNVVASDELSYKALSGKVTLWYLGAKKHPEYLMHQSNFNAVKAVLEKITADGGVEDARKEIAPCIEYLEGLKTKYTEDSKKDKKMRYASFYNLAVIYNLLDMPDEAIKQAEGLIANDYDKSDGKRLIKDAEKLKKSFADNKTNTSHFPISWLSEK